MFARQNTRFQRIVTRNFVAFASSLIFAATAASAAGCSSDDDDDNQGTSGAGAAAGQGGSGGGSGSGGGGSGGSNAGAGGGGGSGDDGCARGALEADLNDNGTPLAGQTKLQGPGVDPATGKLRPGSYVFSSTYLRMPSGPQAQARFGELAGPVVSIVPTQPGLVAFAFSGSTSCNTVRTFTAWESEEAMYAFAATGEHRTAASASSEVSRGGSAVTHWSGSEADATWEKSATELGDTPAFD